jgi:hypothetical protein
MAILCGTDKFYDLFTLSGAFSGATRMCESPRGGNPMVVGIAVAMFVALFGWGATYFGWDDPHGRIQLALATSFILGIVRV